VDIVAPRFSSALDAAIITLAAAASLAAMRRQLPLQNVVPAALATALIGGIAHGLSANSNISMPLGPVVFDLGAGKKILGFVPWTIPLLWIVALFNARGMARLILRPWRKVKNYGFWLMGLTAALAGVFDVALEPFAGHVKHSWHWEQTKIPITWGGAPLLNFIGWVCVSLLIMVIITPFFIRKQPGSSSAPDLHPLGLWLGALLLFTVGLAGAGHWWAAGVDAAILAATTVFAVRGAKW
jgi:uncharacterized membrane protein